MLHLGWFDHDKAMYCDGAVEEDEEFILYHSSVEVLGLRIP